MLGAGVPWQLLYSQGMSTPPPPCELYESCVHVGMNVYKRPCGDPWLVKRSLV